jgi:hypothetical protein
VTADESGADVFKVLVANIINNGAGVVYVTNVIVVT